MKKSLIALAVLGSFAGAASAANTVTLWGKIDTAYEAGKTKSTDAMGVTTSTTGKLKMSDAGESRIGIKVKEDLGNGLSAFVRLEGALTSDVGSGAVDFHRESVIGLSTNFGDVYFGRSLTPMDKVSIGVGNRSGDMGSSYAGISRFSNAAFYAYDKNGVSVYAAMSTKGGQFDTNLTENAAGSKAAYSLAAKYAGQVSNVGYTVAAAYQATNDKLTAYGVKNAWLVNTTMTFNPVTVGLSYSQNKNFVTTATESLKGVKYRAYVSADLTSNDNVYLQYTGEKDTLKDSAFASKATLKTTTWGLGYAHSLSKRTAVFADVGRQTAKTKVAVAGLPTVMVSKDRTTSYNIGLRHSF